MKIGIDALAGNRGGVLGYIRDLLTAWHEDGSTRRHRFVFYGSGHTIDHLAPELLRNLEVHRMPSSDRGMAARFWAEQVELPRRLRVDRPDVVFCPATSMPYTSDIPCVCTFHTAGPVCAQDGSVKTLPSSLRFRWWLTGWMMRRSARKARRIIFLSRYVREPFVESGLIPASRAELIYHGRPPDARPDAAKIVDLRRRHGLPEGYDVSVSHLYAYKNLDNLIAAVAGARVRGYDMPLVIAGADYLGGERERLENIARDAGVSAQVRFLGDMAPSDVPPLVAGARAFVFTSSCENCPVSLLEALALGVPVACSGSGAMAEIVGGAAAVFDPADPDSIADTLLVLHGDGGLRNRLVDAGRARWQEFPDQAEVARRTLSVIENAAA